ncbi:MAG: hypothetical protein AB7G44_03085, partial [Bacteroidia bacterium]
MQRVSKFSQTVALADILGVLGILGAFGFFGNLAMIVFVDFSLSVFLIQQLQGFYKPDWLL